MPTTALHCLSEVFLQVPDPRSPRGIRHPFAGILSLVFLGMLARIRELAELQFWATIHWEELKDPLGFDSDQPPHATTISRALANFSLVDFQTAFGDWLQTAIDAPEEISVVAVDAKTCRQGYDAEGSPVQLLNVFAHQAKLTLAQWSVRGEKTNEPGVLRGRLESLLKQYPMLRLITGDAIYAQRPLAELLVDSNIDYLLQVKKNQGNLCDALKNCFAKELPPDVETIEKKVAVSKLVACGAIWTTPNTAESNLASQAAASSSAWSVWSLPETDGLLVVM